MQHHKWQLMDLYQLDAIDLQKGLLDITYQSNFLSPKSKKDFM